MNRRTSPQGNVARYDIEYSEGRVNPNVSEFFMEEDGEEMFAPASGRVNDDFYDADGGRGNMGGDDFFNASADNPDAYMPDGYGADGEDYYDADGDYEDADGDYEDADGDYEDADGDYEDADGDYENADGDDFYDMYGGYNSADGDYNYLEGDDEYSNFFTKKSRRSIGRFFKKAGKGIEKGVREAGRGIRKGAKAVGKGVSKLGKNIGGLLAKKGEEGGEGSRMGLDLPMEDMGAEVTPTKKGLSTGAIIGIGAGVILLGVLVYVLSKPRK